MNISPPHLDGFHDLKIGESVKDEKRVGRPILHRNPEKGGLRDIEEETGISKSLVGSIIKEDLQLKKTPSKFVPKMLTIQQKENRVEVAKKCLKWWNITLIGRKKTKKSRLCKSKNKVLLVTFFDIKGIVYYEYLEEGQTINKKSYLNIMRRVRESIRLKRSEMWSSKNDNAPPHTATSSSPRARPDQELKAALNLDRSLPFGEFMFGNAVSECKQLNRIRTSSKYNSPTAFFHRGPHHRLEEDSIAVGKNTWLIFFM
ncbi:hypothetical protein LAZ67_3003126 [Cordylochernes scorpioides]|uniref:Transposase n=1 Tax=Cordylochernes scorpioides TaxID=51811 RepID=A0ABY6K8A8_9ARAC|nr:hypothetical protein LAZ67_3003126 [Cordylochernes scorpioides]